MSIVERYAADGDDWVTPAGVRVGRGGPPGAVDPADYGPLTFGGGSAGDPALVPSGFPNGYNTGLAADGTKWSDLQVSDTGDIDQNWLNANNGGSTIIEGWRFPALRFGVDNLTFRRCLVVQTGRDYAVDATYAGENRQPTFEFCEISGVEGATAAVGLRGATLKFCNVYGADDNVKFGGTGEVIEDCYIHDQMLTEGGHVDAMQASGALSGTRIRRNTIMGRYVGSTSAIIVLGKDISTATDVEVIGNFMSGGSYSMYLRGDDVGAFTDIVVRDNVFGKDSTLYGPVSITGAGPTWLWGNNRLTDGTLIDAPSGATSED